MNTEQRARGFDAWWKSIAVSSEEPETMDDRTLAETAWNAAIALSPPASAAVVPEGWVLVPRENALAAAALLEGTGNPVDRREAHALRQYAATPTPPATFEDAVESIMADNFFTVEGAHAEYATPPATAQEDGRDAKRLGEEA